jgi:hypothetical protein
MRYAIFSARREASGKYVDELPAVKYNDFVMFLPHIKLRAESW